jgi:hypothetical protein
MVSTNGATIAAGEITLGDQVRQVRKVNRREAPGWALRIRSRFDAAVHGPIGFAAVSAPTLGDSIAVLARYGYVRSPYYRIETRIRSIRAFQATAVAAGNAGDG